MQLTTDQHDALARLTMALIDQDAATVLVAAETSADGYWFGAGNLVRADDAIWLSGRYRNGGDARTGLAAGARGASCAIFRSDTGSMAFERVASWAKADVAVDAPVLSIEGVALRPRSDGDWELFVSSEKEMPYPDPYAPLQKPGTGIWTIERMSGRSPDALDPASIETVLRGRAPEALHVKDPVVFDRESRTHMLFSAHPVTWASSNTGMAIRQGSNVEFGVETWQLVARGAVWDVAATRVTDRLPIPRIGVFADTPAAVLLFYDGAESMRPLDASPKGASRPRGWSCEEIGGAMWAPAGRLDAAMRLSEVEAWFTSPHGTRSSRYVKTLTTDEGIHATWQQAQPDGSQPLVGHFLPHDRIRDLLS